MKRSVGKSELIKRVIFESDVKAIFYECKQISEMNNVESLERLISKIYSLPKLSFNNIGDTLKFLFEYSSQENGILVLD